MAVFIDECHFVCGKNCKHENCAIKKGCDDLPVKELFFPHIDVRNAYRTDTECWYPFEYAAHCRDFIEKG